MDNKTKSYYECHVTMLGDPEKIKPIVESLTNWKFSAINGDPVLGDGVKCYATYFYKARFDQASVVSALHSIAQILNEAGCNVIRRKVELVMYDDRSSAVNTCDGACVECHLDDYNEKG